jgi:formylglycine-generating enzyme required for sulfatase activity
MALTQRGSCVDRYEGTLETLDKNGRWQARSPFTRPHASERVRAVSRRGVVPQAYVSQLEAAKACAGAGKRLCTNAEWFDACRGKVPTSYPYGTAREPGRCNDRGVSPLLRLFPDGDAKFVFSFETMNDPRLNQLAGTVARTGQFDRCGNSYGLKDMVGNLHEWTADPSGVFMGGYYLDTTQHGEGCHYMTTGHDTRYHDYSIGFRCCSDPQR